MNWLKRKKTHVESSNNTGSSSEVIRKVVTTNDLDDRCLIAQTSPQPGQVHSQGHLPPTNADQVPKNSTLDHTCVTNSVLTNEINDQHEDLTSCSMVKTSSLNEVNIQNKVQHFFEMNGKIRLNHSFYMAHKRLQILHMTVRLKSTISG